MQDHLQVFNGLRTARHGAHIALGGHARQMVLWFGLQPHRVAVGKHFIEGRGVRHQTAWGGNHHLWIDLNRLLQCTPLVSAVRMGAVEVVDFRNAAAGKLLDLAAQFHKGVAQIGGQAGPQSRFARTPQANQSDSMGARSVGGGTKHLCNLHAHAAQFSLAARAQHFTQQQPFRRGGGDIAQQLRQRALQSTGHLQQDQDRSIAFAIFKAGQMSFRHIGRHGHRLARHPTSSAQYTHPLSERDQEWVLYFYSFCHLQLSTQSD